MTRRQTRARRIAAERVCGPEPLDELSQAALRALAILVWVAAPIAGMFVMAWIFKKVVF